MSTEAAIELIQKKTINSRQNLDIEIMQKLESEKVVIQTLKNLRDIFDKVSLERVAQLAGNQNA